MYKRSCTNAFATCCTFDFVPWFWFADRQIYFAITKHCSQSKRMHHTWIELLSAFQCNNKMFRGTTRFGKQLQIRGRHVTHRNVPSYADFQEITEILRQTRPIMWPPERFISRQTKKTRICCILASHWSHPRRLIKIAPQKSRSLIYDRGPQHIYRQHTAPLTRTHTQTHKRITQIKNMLRSGLVFWWAIRVPIEAHAHLRDDVSIQAFAVLSVRVIFVVSITGLYYILKYRERRGLTRFYVIRVVHNAASS